MENPGIAIKITNIIGIPIEEGIKKLPKSWSEKIGKITNKALLKASEAAIFTMKDIPGERSSDEVSNWASRQVEVQWILWYCRFGH